MQESVAELKLTEFSQGSGCGCKLSPADLEAILAGDESPVYADLLVGNETRDDAAVLKIENGSALISTTDFFTPIVNDPFDFGAVAAANALSDVYAMGGDPALAIGILGWPIGKLPADAAAQVMQGARETCKQAGIPLAGGHSIDNPQPFFGLAVNGFAAVSSIRKNSTAKEGDLLFLTKPLGIGMYATAHKRGLLNEEQYAEFVSVMRTLNSAGSKFGKVKGVNAMTDITGFGLLGHLIEMTTGSGVSAELELKQVQKLSIADDLMNKFVYPDNTTRNWKSYSAKVDGITGLEFILLSDPQTSGGLLVSVSPRMVAKYMDVAKSNGVEDRFLKPVGLIIPKGEKEVYVK